MKHLKRYDEGFLDLFRKKYSDDDKIILDFMKRLERIKDVSPYEIEFNTDGTEPGESYDSTYKVIFDDVKVCIKKVEVDRKYRDGWSQETQKGWIESGAIRKNDHIFYGVSVYMINGKETLTPSPKITEEFFELIKKVNKQSKYKAKINKIRGEMNPAADLLNPEIYPDQEIKESIYEREVVFTNERKRIERISSEINSAADLLKEGLFDFFSKKVNEDDKIALEYINRLKKVKGISPYKITYDPGQRGENNFKIDKWVVDFDDTPIKLWSAISLISNGFDYQCQELLISKGLSKYSKFEFYGLNVICVGDPENCKASAKVLKELVELVESVYKNDKEARRIENIKTNMNKGADLINDEPIKESIYEREVVFTNKRNPRLVITIKKNPDGRITEIQNETGMRFPFSVGQILNRTAEVWACNNNFLMDGKDTCPDKKIFGVKTKDVPQGHEWRHIFPHKF